MHTGGESGVRTLNRVNGAYVIITGLSKRGNTHFHKYTR